MANISMVIHINAWLLALACDVMYKAEQNVGLASHFFDRGKLVVI